MSDHKFENINGVGILTSVLTPEPLNDIETLKLIAPYEIPRLREEIDTLKLEIAYLILNKNKLNLLHSVWR